MMGPLSRRYRQSMQLLVVAMLLLESEGADAG